MELIPDVNRDGHDDLLIGGTGAALILFGKANWSNQILDLGVIHPGQGFVLVDDTGLYQPLQVSSAGDVNGDGVNDVLVGQPSGQDAQGQAYSGNSYVLFGGSSLSTGTNNTLGLSALNGKNGFKIIGAGTQVNGAGDLNRDFVADLIVSEPDAQNQAGETFIIYGGLANQIGTVSSINVSQVGTSVQGYVIGQAGANQLSGSSASSIGDINGDGLIDLLVGAPYTIPSTELSNLQSTISANFLTGKLVNNQVVLNHSSPTLVPNLQPGEDLQSLTSTSFGILAIIVNGNSLLGSFWQVGTGWQGFQTIATLNDSNSIFIDIAINPGNPVIVSWGATDGETSTTIPGQSIYNGRGWNNSGFNTTSNEIPTGGIDNIISSANVNPQFSIHHQHAKESDGNIVFTVGRQEDNRVPVTWNYRTEDITATATSDYEHLEGSITFLPGELSKTIEVRLFEDSLEEHLGEKFQLVLTPSTDHSLSPLSATVTLTDTNPTINLLAIDSGFQMVGPANSLLTYAISSAGDVDGDGYGEFFISAPGYNSSQGKIYLVAGSPGIEVANQGLNIDDLVSGQGLAIIGVGNASTQGGYTLANWNDYYAISAPNLSRAS